MASRANKPRKLVPSKSAASRSRPGGRGGAKRKTTRRRAPPGIKKESLRSKRDGCTITISITERVEGKDDVVQAVGEFTLSGPRAKPGVRRKTLATPTTKDCVALAALGHVQRIKIMAKLLDGPATYQSLQHTTKLGAGPLYHHINQLRLAGLLLPKQRDLYELTRGGRNLALVGTVAAKLARDRSRRPIAKG